MDYWERPSSDDSFRQPHFAFRPRRSLTPGVKWIILITVSIYVLELFVMAGARRGAASGEEVASRFLAVFGPFGLWPSDVFGRGFIWQFVTYAFLHAPGNLFHILFNMLFLYWFGRSIEQQWGMRRFMLFYLTSAIFAAFIFSIVHIWFEQSWCVGASGAVMAVLMVYALYWPNQLILVMFIFPMRIRTFVTILVVIETLSFLRMRGNVANMAHLGGLLYGFLVVRYGPLLAHVASGSRQRASRASMEDERRLDEILDKVQRYGMGSLSWGEKRFLRKMSKR